MPRSFSLYLDDIHMAATKVVRYTTDYSLEQFVDDERTFDAVIRNLEVIGEATKHIPAKVRIQYANIEWRKIAGLRDILAHDYFGIDATILWDIIQNHVPALLTVVAQMRTEVVED